jgi:hypothetical protein
MKLPAVAAAKLTTTVQLAEEALAIIESRRRDVNAPGLKSSFYGSTRDYHDLSFRVLMALHVQTRLARQLLTVATDRSMILKYHADEGSGRTPDRPRASEVRFGGKVPL